MNDGISSFGEACLWILPLVIVFSIFLSAFFKGLAQHSDYGKQIVVVLSYILCVGVVVHEAAHQLMCKIFNVKIREVRYFKVESERVGDVEHTSIGGHVDCERVESLIVGLFLGFAPLLVNGLLVALIYYFSPVWMESEYHGVLIYLGVALALGARPSREDLALSFHTLQSRPGRAVIEILFLGVFGGVLCYLVAYQFELWITLTVLATFIVLCIVQGRFKPRKSYGGYIARYEKNNS